MKKNKKLLLIILIPIIIIGCIIAFNSFSVASIESIQTTWNIKIPDNGKETYTTNDENGYSYSTFKYENINKLDKSLDWKTEKDYDFEIKVREILQQLNIEKDNYPNFYSHYKFYENTKDDGSVLYLIFNDSDKTLVIAEHMV